MNEVEILKKKSLWTAVFTNYELLGWYTLGTEVVPNHLDIHFSMKMFNESPLFLLMNSQPDVDSKVLPLTVYEMVTHFVGETPTQIFIDLPFKLDTAQSERVAVDEVVKSTPHDGSSSLEAHNQSSVTSLKTLGDKIDIIMKVLEAMQSGVVPLDMDILRRVSKICDHIPVIDGDEFLSDFNNEMMDGLMLTYLASATRSIQTMHELTDTYNLVYGEKTSRFRP